MILIGTLLEDTSHVYIRIRVLRRHNGKSYKELEDVKIEEEHFGKALPRSIPIKSNQEA